MDLAKPIIYCAGAIHYYIGAKYWPWFAKNGQLEYSTVQVLQEMMADDSAAASHSYSERSPSKDCHEGEICFVCLGVILEADAEKDGEPALFCEGRHKHMLAAWASARFCTKIFVRVTHRGCAKTA